MSVLLVLAVVVGQSPEATRIDDPEAFGCPMGLSYTFLTESRHELR